MRKFFVSFGILFLLLGQNSCREKENEMLTENRALEPIKSDENYDYIITPEKVQGDFRVYFQKILNSYKNILIKDGTYEMALANGAGVMPQNGTTLTFAHNAKIKIKPNAFPAYSMFSFANRKDITLINPQLEGDKHTHTAKNGEWGHGLNLTGGSNITIKSPRISKMWGDAIYLSASENVKIYKAHLFDNRRQAITIISGKNIEIHDLLAENTGGTAPGYGIDIEPNFNGEGVTGLKIYNPIFRNNGVGGSYPAGFSFSTHQIHTLKSGASGLVPTYFEIEMNNPVFEGDGMFITAYSDYVRGSFKMNNPVFKKSRNTGIFITNHSSDHFHTEINNPKLEDCVTTNEKNIYLAPIIFYTSHKALKNVGLKNITIKNPVITASASATFKNYGIRNITPNTFKEDLRNVKILNAEITGYNERFYNHSGNPKTTGTPHSSFVITYK